MLLSSDVVDYTFSFLQADIATLKSCSRADPLLSRLAERYLYYSTTLDIKPGDNVGVTELSSLLLKNPRIRNFIRILTINIFKGSESLVSDRTLMMETILSILSTLPRLNKVTLTLASSLTVWNKIHKSFCSAFAGILQQSSVSEVQLEGLSAFPLSVFNTCQHIKSLSLSNCGTFKSSNSLPSPHLESLSIQDSDDPTLFGWAIERIGKLTTLELRHQHEKFGDIPKVFAACARSLTCLKLEVHQLCQCEQFLEGAPVLSHLEHLTISSVIWAFQEKEGEIIYDDFGFYSAIHAIAKLIESSAPSLRHVVLRFFCNAPNIEIHTRTAFPFSLATFPHIEFCLESSTEHEFSPGAITNTFAQHEIGDETTIEFLLEILGDAKSRFERWTYTTS